MKFSFESPSQKEELGVDFPDKRLRLWLETVPPELRRLEYDLYKQQRRFLNAARHRFDHRKKLGKFTVIPAFTEDLDKDGWQSFQKSFLGENERRERFTEIIKTIKSDLPEILDKRLTRVPREKIKLIALGGSALIGPRRPGEFLSDIDLNFLLDTESAGMNFDMLPDTKDTSEVPYHLFGTGLSDDARGKNRDVHWLLYPYLPIQSSISNEDLRHVTQNLVAATLERRGQIQTSIEKMGDLLEKSREEEIIG